MPLRSPRRLRGSRRDGMRTNGYGNRSKNRESVFEKKVEEAVHVDRRGRILNYSRASQKLAIIEQEFRLVEEAELRRLRDEETAKHIREKIRQDELDWERQQERIREIRDLHCRRHEKFRSVLQSVSTPTDVCSSPRRLLSPTLENVEKLNRDTSSFEATSGNRDQSSETSMVQPYICLKSGNADRQEESISLCIETDTLEETSRVHSSDRNSSIDSDPPHSPQSLLSSDFQVSPIHHQHYNFYQSFFSRGSDSNPTDPLNDLVEEGVNQLSIDSSPTPCCSSHLVESGISENPDISPSTEESRDERPTILSSSSRLFTSELVIMMKEGPGGQDKCHRQQNSSRILMESLLRSVEVDQEGTGQPLMVMQSLTVDTSLDSASFADSNLSGLPTRPGSLSLYHEQPATPIGSSHRICENEYLPGTSVLEPFTQLDPSESCVSRISQDVISVYEELSSIPNSHENLSSSRSFREVDPEIVELENEPSTLEECNEDDDVSDEQEIDETGHCESSDVLVDAFL